MKKASIKLMTAKAMITELYSLQQLVEKQARLLFPGCSVKLIVREILLEVPDINEPLHTDSNGTTADATVEENFYFTNHSAGTYLSNPLEEKIFVNYQFIKQ